MDTNNKANNPVYSRNDPSVVNLTDEQWKKILPTWVTFSTTALLLRV